MFDYDGVVADSLDVFFEEFSQACRELGFEHMNSREALLRLFETNAIAALIKAGFPLRRLRRLGQEFAPRIAAANRRVQPFTGMPEVLQALASRYPLYVITSNITATIEDFLEAYQITGVRDVLGADKERSKVKKIRSVVRAHRDARPFYIGDTKGDMLEARAARVSPVAVAWGWHPLDKLREASPDHVVHAPEELLRLFEPRPDPGVPDPASRR